MGICLPRGSHTLSIQQIFVKSLLQVVSQSRRKRFYVTQRKVIWELCNSQKSLEIELHLFSKSLSSAYYIPDTVLGTEDTEMNKTCKNLLSWNLLNVRCLEFLSLNILGDNRTI